MTVDNIFAVGLCDRPHCDRHRDDCNFSSLYANFMIEIWDRIKQNIKKMYFSLHLRTITCNILSSHKSIFVRAF